VKKKIQKKINRSNKFSCPICETKTILVEHHINGRNIRNSEAPANKVNICSNCHRLIHEGLIIIEGWVYTSQGLKLFWHNKGEESFTGKTSTPPLYGMTHKNQKK
jgi:uncharacterized membrane protein